MKVTTLGGDEMHVNPSNIICAYEDAGLHTVRYVDGSTDCVDMKSYEQIVAWMDRLPHA